MSVKQRNVQVNETKSGNVFAYTIGLKNAQYCRFSLESLQQV